MLMCQMPMYITEDAGGIFCFWNLAQTVDLFVDQGVTRGIVAPLILIVIMENKVPSKTWSCGSLEAGSKQLMAVKGEAKLSRKESLELQKQAGAMNDSYNHHF